MLVSARLLLCLPLLLSCAQIARAANAAPSAAVLAVGAEVRAGRLDHAVELGEALVQRSPEDAFAWSWLGRAYGRQAQQASLFRQPGWASKCREAFERAVALDGSRVDARLDVLQFYAMAPSLMGGSRDKAQEQVKAIAALDPIAGHVAAAQLAQMTDKDPALAERELRSALALAPRDPRARNSLTQLLMQQKRWNDAFAVWEPALSGEPADVLAHYAFGRIAAISGERLADGLKQLDLYLLAANKPDDISEAAVHWRKGLVLEKLGRADEALVELNLATTLDGAPEDAKKDLARVGKLVRNAAG